MSKNSTVQAHHHGQIILYKNRLEVRLEEETVWLSLNQIANLFGRDKTVISKHFTNIYKEKELSQNSTVAFFATVQNEGGRQVERTLEYYNLDAIISVGYRVNSKQGTQFCIWATQDGYRFCVCQVQTQPGTVGTGTELQNC